MDYQNEQSSQVINLTAHQHLTPKYCKSSSNSEWANMMKFLYKIKDDPSQQDKIKELLNLFVKQLQIDEIKFNNGSYKDITDCAIHAPRLSSTLDKRTMHFRMGHYCAQQMYLDTNRMKELLHALVHYSRLISRLSKAFVDERIKEEVLKAEHKTVRLLEHQRKGWCELKKREIAIPIGKPTAMKVDVAPLAELADFFSHLSSDGDITKEPHTEFKRGVVYPDGRMDLCKQVVGPTWIGDLMNSLKTNSKIEHFLLGNNITSEEGGEAIKQFLQEPHACKIKTWYLAGSDFNSKAMKSIVDGLAHDTDMEALWLKRNPLYAEGMVSIRHLLENHNKIHILDLHNTAMGLKEKAYDCENHRYEQYLTDDGMVELCEGLKQNTSLRHLYLDANALTATSMDYLRSYFEFKLKTNTRGIHSLWIDMNKLGDEGIRTFVPILRGYNIKRLNLGSTMMSEEGAKIIAETFANHPTLQVLDLSLYKSTADMGAIVNNLTDTSVPYLCQLIESNTSLLYLNISMNNINNEGISAIAQSLMLNDTLLFMPYKQYGVGIDQPIVHTIETKLQQNRTIYEELTGIKTDGDFARNLKHSHRIKNIDSIYRNNMKV